METVHVKDEEYTTLKIKAKTKRELLKMQASYQLQSGERVTLDQIIWTFIQSQPVETINWRSKKG
jgi:hypothetical protein